MASYGPQRKIAMYQHPIRIGRRGYKSINVVWFSRPEGTQDQRTIGTSRGSGSMDTADGALIPDANDLTDEMHHQPSQPQYFIKVSPGKKKFAPKVRSGCLTCKYVLLAPL